MSDNYEPNNSRSSAYYIGNDEQTWLSNINGFGFQSDEDWYEIFVDSGYENLVVNLDFTHANGDIDLAVYDDNGNWVTSSTSSSDDEYIDTILPSSGSYYLKVYFGNAGNIYDLWWDDVEVGSSDDNYEPNDSRTSAYDIGNDEQTWLSNINGFGVQSDEDWYKIFVDSGYENLVVDLDFTDADGDIDLAVYDDNGNWVTSSTSSSDNEYIDTILPSSGNYYLKVYLGNAGNTYDLWWDDVEVGSSDDNYEPNDSRTSAYDIGNDEQTWLSNINGFGVQSDEDWYKIFVDSGYENLVVNLDFTHANGDIDLAVYDDNGNWVTSSTSSSDNEYIDTILPSSGNYYLKVHFDNAGNTYDLWWDDVEVTQHNVSDFNSDSKTDLVWRNLKTGRNSIWLMDGTNRISSVSINSVPDESWEIKGTGDFNYDGKTDLVWRNLKTGRNSVWLMDGTSRITSVALNSVNSSNWDIKTVGDLNGDGQEDLVWRNDITGQNAVWLMDGKNRIGRASLNTVPDTNWDIKGSGDFNDDGHTDLIWRNQATGRSLVWFMDNTTKISSADFNLVSNTQWDIQGAGDFNDDGQMDLVWRNEKLGRNSVWLMDGTSRISSVALNSVGYGWDVTL